MNHNSILIENIINLLIEKNSISAIDKAENIAYLEEHLAENYYSSWYKEDILHVLNHEMDNYPMEYIPYFKKNSWFYKIKEQDSTLIFVDIDKAFCLEIWEIVENTMDSEIGMNRKEIKYAIKCIFNID